MNHTIPNSMKLNCLVNEFLWVSSSSNIRPWLPSITKVFVKRNHTNPDPIKIKSWAFYLSNSCSYLLASSWWPFSTKILVKTNHMSSNSMGLCHLITEFHDNLRAASSKPGYYHQNIYEIKSTLLIWTYSYYFVIKG